MEDGLMMLKTALGLATGLVAVLSTTTLSAQTVEEIATAAKAEGMLTTIALPRDWCNYGEMIDTFAAKYSLEVNELDPNAGSADELEAIRAKLAAETGLTITVVHYPPGTSKWNKIEHRLFSFISMNWRGRPLTSIRTIIELIAATTTSIHAGRWCCEGSETRCLLSGGGGQQQRSAPSVLKSAPLRRRDAHSS